MSWYFPLAPSHTPTSTSRLPKEKKQETREREREGGPFEGRKAKALVIAARFQSSNFICWLEEAYELLTSNFR